MTAPDDSTTTASASRTSPSPSGLASWIPIVRSVGIASRENAAARQRRELDQELTRRESLLRDALVAVGFDFRDTPSEDVEIETARQRVTDLEARIEAEEKQRAAAAEAAKTQRATAIDALRAATERHEQAKRRVESIQRLRADAASDPTPEGARNRARLATTLEEVTTVAREEENGAREAQARLTSADAVIASQATPGPQPDVTAARLQALMELGLAVTRTPASSASITRVRELQESCRSLFQARERAAVPPNTSGISLFSDVVGVAATVLLLFGASLGDMGTGADGFAGLAYAMAALACLVWVVPGAATSHALLRLVIPIILGVCLVIAFARTDSAYDAAGNLAANVTFGGRPPMEGYPLPIGALLVALGGLVCAASLRSGLGRWSPRALAAAAGFVGMTVLAGYQALSVRGGLEAARMSAHQQYVARRQDVVDHPDATIAMLTRTIQQRSDSSYAEAAARDLRELAPSDPDAAAAVAAYQDFQRSMAAAAEAARAQAAREDQARWRAEEAQRQRAEAASQARFDICMNNCLAPLSDCLLRGYRREVCMQNFPAYQECAQGCIFQ